MKYNRSISTVVVGLVLVAVGTLTQQVMPVIGRAAYQAAAAGSYSPGDYHLNLIWFYVIAVIVIALGIAQFVMERRSP